eukprot:8165239-Ditylum_brightwellii.AAC.1
MVKLSSKKFEKSPTLLGPNTHSRAVATHAARSKRQSCLEHRSMLWIFYFTFTQDPLKQETDMEAHSFTVH